MKGKMKGMKGHSRLNRTLTLFSAVIQCDSVRSATVQRLGGE